MNCFQNCRRRGDESWAGGEKNDSSRRRLQGEWLVNAAPRICLFLFLALAAAFSVAAKDLADYRVGDVAEADLTTFVPLDVPDAVATAAQQASAMEKIPSVFRDFPHAATNQMAVEFSTVMAVVHGKFKAALQKEFSTAALAEEKISAPEFTNFVASFISANNRFPVNAALAAEWARGGSGAEMTGGLLARLFAAMHRPVCADRLPPDFFAGENFFAVPVSRPDDVPALAEVEANGRFIAASNFITVSQLRLSFRQSFSEDEQPFAAALAGFLRPVCAPDLALTEQYRRQSASQSVVMVHFNQGQVIIPRGRIVDEKTLAAITQLREKTAPQKNAAAAAAAVKKVAPAKTVPAPAPNYLGWGASGLAGIVAFYFFLKAARPRRQIPLVTQAAAMSGQPVLFAEVLDGRMQVQPPASVNELLKSAPSGLAPQFVDALKEAVVTELATQRRDLIFAQQAAAAEIADLARRLESVQAPLLERLRAYEQRIHELEAELADQSKQNRELVQLKIEMLRQQIRAESNPRPANFN